MSNDDVTEYSESGQPIYSHQERDRDFELATGDDALIQAISDHYERHLGPIENVLHELVSDLVHIDVHIIAPRPDRPFYTLATSGMSDRPMTVPEGAEAFQFAELIINLPPTWSLDYDDFQDERVYWPIRWLKQLARLPHMYETWLGYGHTIPNGDPPEPFARGTKLTGMLVEFPINAPEEFHVLELPDRSIRFWTLMPLYTAEMQLKLSDGTEALEALFDEHGVSDIVDLKRTNVCKPKRFFGLF